MTNTFEYIFVKDMHLAFAFRNNVRKHPWEKAIDHKLDQIINYMSENNLKYLFTAGDIFDKSRRKDWSFNQFQANKKRLQKFKDAGIELWSNIGNHDYFDGAETVQGTVFGEMADLGLINYIGTGMEPQRFKAGEVGEVLLFGIDYHTSIDKVIDQVAEISKFPRGVQSSKLLLIHSNVTSDATIVADLSYKQLSKYDIDVINCGHLHLVPKAGAIQELDETHFLNPWNLVRVVRDYHTKLDEHKPEFIHARVQFVADEKPIYDFEEIFLEVGKFSETFDVSIINMLQELGKSKFGFFDEVGEELNQEEDMSDDALLIKNLASTHSISEDSVKIAKELIA